MDFFAHQERARKRTTRLVVLFIIGFLCTFAATYLLVFTAIELMLVANGYADTIEAGANPTGVELWDPMAALLAGGATLLIIGGGTLYKISELRGGGPVIAAHLGGRLLDRGSADLPEKRLLNVVEEMAIASGTPVPPVYVLDREQGINAFAAGFTPDDAVIGITRGAIESLSRDELQGVIAHEFSHILNGDMRLNLRLIGILHGILVLSLIGQLITRAVWYTPRSRSDRGGGALYLLALGLGLIVIGSVGSLFGNLIKSAVSRQREYLADASAVQFTRNPAGIAGALKRILGLSIGSRLQSPNAPEASHMFFGQAIYSGFAGLFATHPPLRKRILRIEPDWDGRVETVSPAPLREHKPSRIAGEQPTRAHAMAALAGAAVTDAAPGATLQPARPIVERIGLLEREDVEHARAMLDRLPGVVRLAAEHPFSAQAIIFALLTDGNPVIAEAQLGSIAELAGEALARQTRALLEPVRDGGPELRLVMIDLALPSLRQLSRSQYELFRSLIARMVAADRRTSLFEWCVQRIVLMALDANFGLRSPASVHYYSLLRLGSQVQTLLSALARVGQSEDEARRRAFLAGAARLPELSLQDMNEGRLADLTIAVNELARVAAPHKKKLIEACAAVLSADGRAKAVEAELFRAIASALGVPVPPILPGTPLA
ncbi:MAG: M48 family metallopeptidase [Phycisphaerales bacterium]